MTDLPDGIPGLVATTSTRHLFLTGKGGVGKTSTACATAIGLAGLGRRVLLVSTDPASDLDEVLGQTVATTPTPITGVPGLSALNVDPEAAAAAYRERVIGPYRGLAGMTVRSSGVRTDLRHGSTCGSCRADGFAGGCRSSLE